MMLERLKNFNELIKSCECTTDSDKEIEISQSFYLTTELIENTKKNKGTIYIIGNNQVASQISTELIKNLNISASSLIDLNLFMSFSCDYGYENSYMKLLQVLLREEDLLITMSNTGQASNILNAVYLAKKKNVKIITLTGKPHFNPLKQIGDLNYWFNSSDSGLIEICYSFVLEIMLSKYAQMSQKGKILK